MQSANYENAKETPTQKEHKEQMAKSLISTIEFKSPEASHHGRALFKNNEESIEQPMPF